MKRLYLQIYAAVLGVIVLFSILAGVAIWLFQETSDDPDFLGQIEAFAEAVTPPADASPERLQQFAEALAEPFSASVTLYDADREILAQVGRRLPEPPQSGGTQWLHRRRHYAKLHAQLPAQPHGLPPGPGMPRSVAPGQGRRHRTLALALADGRWILIDGRRRGRPTTHLFVALAILTFATGIIAYPLTRRLTRRLEGLKDHVEAFGEGDLAHRVIARDYGKDEIADLANAFNRAAEQIQGLVADKTRLLANTSHELRSPLARIRMAIALLEEGSRPDILARITHDIEELDALIGELLIASRLDAPGVRLELERVDLLALAAEEAARVAGVEVHGESQFVDGDPRLLRRLVRNLLENALRHGEPPIEVEVFTSGRDGTRGKSGRVTLIVSDAGRGVPESERDRIFESFYRPPGMASAEGGIGLGLALVRQIAESHHGTVHCEAREDGDGGSTRFVLNLPAAQV